MANIAKRSDGRWRARYRDAGGPGALAALHPQGGRADWLDSVTTAVAAGANVKVVQTMLGHKSATMTLDLYGHLFENQLDEVADAMDAGASCCGLFAD